MDFIEAIKTAGVVGAGGAGFPTHVKLSAKANCFIVNAAECEPLIETDKYLCRTFPHKLIKGTIKISEHLGAERTVIVLKGKYKAEIAALERAIADLDADVEIFPMGTFYPAGDEQIIVQQVCGVSVPERGIPLSVGAVVDNVGTVLGVFDALKGTPVTEKYLSVVGEVRQNTMVRAPLGTPITDCIAAAGPGLQSYAVIVGGPMMGKILTGEEIGEAVVTKTTGNLLILPEDHYLIKRNAVPLDRLRVQAKSACIQCRMCTDLCPRYLIGHRIRPHLVMRNFWREPGLEDNEEFKRAFGDAANCCDCGACEMFSCPMGLSPKRVNFYLKEVLRRRGIEVERNESPVAREDAQLHKIPTGRLVSRLGLREYYGRPLAAEVPIISPDRVHIPLQQHIGKPAGPVVVAGDQVEEGALLARAAEGGLSANIHTGIAGTVTGVLGGLIEISRKGE